ncbi:hypothetical protein EON81_20075 [bacterium]|nr:MAG: hypothetical protein EON81_20075 [bacterium]
MEQRLHRYLDSVGWLRWLFRTRDESIVIAQSPNVPLALALLAKVVEVLSGDPVRRIAGQAAQVSFAVWAILEIGWGVNPFRRILGASVLALIGFNLFKTFA